jgi:hypothetical protein
MTVMGDELDSKDELPCKDDLVIDALWGCGREPQVVMS